MENNLLLVLSADTKNELKLIQKAKEYKNKGHKISLLYLLPRFPAMSFQVQHVAKLYASIQNQAKTLVEQIGNALEIPEKSRFLKSGNRLIDVTSVAAKTNATEVIGNGPISWAPIVKLIQKFFK